MANKIYFYGSLPPKNKAAYGGGEVGNLRTVKMLQSFGYKVVTIRKLRSSSSVSAFVKLFTYPWRMLEGVFMFWVTVMFGSRQSIVHISGFGGHTILNEFLILGIAKSLGYYTIFEIRGGGFFMNTSKAYCLLRNWIVRHADYIFSQGMENKPLLDKICKTPFFYYPNFVDEDFMPSQKPDKKSSTINLIFFGRIEKEKNVKLIVETTKLLQQRFHNITLTIIGNGKSDYVVEVQQMMASNLKAGSYTYLRGCSHDDLKQYLIDKHFYIFPSEQMFEGHSNALTEAMAYGIIPIASPQGFSRTVVGMEELIVNEFSAEQYANRITDFIIDNRFKELSEYVYDRIRENYTDSIVRKQLYNVYSVL